MTRKHFKAIADGLKDSKPVVPANGQTGICSPYKGKLLQWRITCESMADVCSRFNPGFKRDRFLEACGYHD